MPVTRIAISARRLEQWREPVSSALRQSLEQHFAVPPGDCFQLFDSYRPENRVVDPHYLCGAEAGRSDDFLLLQITAGKPRSRCQKQAFYQDLVTRLAQTTGVRPQDVMVVVSFTQAEDWSFGGGQMFSLTDIPAK